MPHTHFSKAHEQYVIAKHLLHTTLPLVKDPKLLIGITHNMYDSMTHASNILTKSPSIPVKTVKISKGGYFSMESDALSFQNSSSTGFGLFITLNASDSEVDVIIK